MGIPHHGIWGHLGHRSSCCLPPIHAFKCCFQILFLRSKTFFWEHKPTVRIIHELDHISHGFNLLWIVVGRTFTNSTRDSSFIIPTLFETIRFAMILDDELEKLFVGISITKPRRQRIAGRDAWRRLVCVASVSLKNA